MNENVKPCTYVQLNEIHCSGIYDILGKVVSVSATSGGSVVHLMDGTLFSLNNGGPTDFISIALLVESDLIQVGGIFKLYFVEVKEIVGTVSENPLYECTHSGLRSHISFIPSYHQLSRSIERSIMDMGNDQNDSASDDDDSIGATSVTSSIKFLYEVRPEAGWSLRYSDSECESMPGKTESMADVVQNNEMVPHNGGGHTADVIDMEVVKMVECNNNDVIQSKSGCVTNEMGTGGMSHEQAHADTRNETHDGSTSPASATHSSEGGFKCDVCNTSYSTRCGLGVHKSKRHNHGKVVCQLCGKRFTQKHGLAIHLSMQHVGK